jgi:hypothetical protein
VEGSFDLSDFGVDVTSASPSEARSLCEEFRGDEDCALSDGLGLAVESPLAEEAKTKVPETAFRHPARISSGA